MRCFEPGENSLSGKLGPQGHIVDSLARVMKLGSYCGWSFISLGPRELLEMFRRSGFGRISFLFGNQSSSGECSEAEVEGIFVHVLSLLDWSIIRVIAVFL